ncbi:MAG TPA: alcohol dehydrogenase [Ruminiclostridium sp.]|nr:alcohol dehydrogenase [Ruminiclostridium sp.]
MIPKLMGAVRLNAPNNLEYCQVPVKEPDEYEVLCKVESVSICGTDPHIINGEYPGFWPKEFPLIPGHEWAGTIVKLGNKAYELGWSVGDRVCGISHKGCGYCPMCLKGRYNLCLNFGKEELGHRQYGHISQGAYAEYMATSIKSIAKIPDDMDFNVAACMDPFSIALHVVMRSRIEPGDSVLINGSGAQGLMAILCARSMGAGTIVVSGSGSRLGAAEKFGAIPIDYHKEDVVARIKEMTHGLGVQRVIECSGTEAGIRNSCEVVAKGGCISIVSLPKSDVQIPIRKIVLDEIDLVGNRANPNTITKAISLAGQYKKELKSMITHEFPLEQYEEALRVFTNREQNSLKVVMKP